MLTLDPTMTDVATRLGERVADARERSGLSFGEFADRAGLEPDAIRAAETGSVTSAQLERIAEASGQSLEFFLAAADEEPVGTLLRAQDGASPQTRAAIDWFEQFVQRYEFLASLDDRE